MVTCHFKLVKFIDKTNYLGSFPSTHCSQSLQSLLTTTFNQFLSIYYCKTPQKQEKQQPHKLYSNNNYFVGLLCACAQRRLFFLSQVVKQIVDNEETRNFKKKFKNSTFCNKKTLLKKIAFTCFQVDRKMIKAINHAKIKIKCRESRERCSATSGVV